MITVLQIFALALIMGVVWYLGYHRGKTIKERELKDMETPELGDNYPDEVENQKRRDYYEFCKAFDSLMTEEDDDTIPDGFSGTTYEDNKYGK